LDATNIAPKDNIIRLFALIVWHIEQNEKTFIHSTIIALHLGWGSGTI
jgi:hypothetical protein